MTTAPSRGRVIRRGPHPGQLSVRRLPANAGLISFLLGALIYWDVAWWFAPPSYSWLVTLLGLPVTLFLPGMLIAGCLGARRPSALNGLFSVGLSLLLLYAVGLGTNFFPLVWGNLRPLDTSTAWVFFNVIYVTLTLIAGSFYRRIGPRKFKLSARRQARADASRREEPRWLGPAISAVAVVSPILAVLGAVTLNNGGDSTLAIRALVLSGLIVPATYVLRRRVGDATMLTVIASATLGLLLATSMRSWFISGQDMQHEFQVFTLAKQTGLWDVTLYSDPYNACLSLNLLPVSLSELLRIDGSLVFKVIYQAIFATVPLTIFCSTRRFLGRGGAFVAALFFIGLPTFSIDVPFITRQQIAFTFVALAMAAAFNRSEAWVRRRRTPLFLCMATGVVFSHYSTAYLFVVGLMMTFVLSRLHRWIARSRRTLRREPHEQISAVAALGAALIAFIWFGPATHASGDLVTKLTASSSSLSQVVNRPQLVLGALSAPSGGSDSLVDYVQKTAVPGTANLPAITRSLQQVSSNTPKTPVTVWIHDHLGVDISAVTSLLYYGFGTKLYLVCCLAGTLALFNRRVRARFGPMPLLYPIWSLAAGTVVGMQLLLPGLAESYGLSRSFMQAFIVMCVPMVAAIRMAFAWSRPVASGVLAVMSTGLLLVYSGILPQLTGGLHRQLSLENAGQYYGTVYPHASDLAAYDWVEQHLPAGTKVNIADYAAAYGYHPLTSMDYTEPGILPFQVKSGNYVLLSTSQTRDHVVYTFGSLIGLAINPELYANSDLVYSAGPVQLYRKR